MRRTRVGLSRDRSPRMIPSQPAPFSSPSSVLVLFSLSISISLAVVGSIGGVFSALLFDGTIELGAAAAAAPAGTPPTPLKAVAEWPYCLLLFSAAHARASWVSFLSSARARWAVGVGQVHGALSGVSWRAWQAVVWVSHLGAVPAKGQCAALLVRLGVAGCGWLWPVVAGFSWF